MHSAALLRAHNVCDATSAMHPHDRTSHETPHQINPGGRIRKCVSSSHTHTHTPAVDCVSTTLSVAFECYLFLLGYSCDKSKYTVSLWIIATANDPIFFFHSFATNFIQPCELPLCDAVSATYLVVHSSTWWTQMFIVVSPIAHRYWADARLFFFFIARRILQKAQENAMLYYTHNYKQMPLDRIAFHLKAIGDKGVGKTNTKWPLCRWFLGS